MRMVVTNAQRTPDTQLPSRIITVKSYSGFDVRFITENGVKWVAASDVGHVIGYNGSKTSKIAKKIARERPENTKIMERIGIGRRDQGFGSWDTRCLNSGGVNHFLNIARQYGNGLALHEFRDWIFDQMRIVDEESPNENFKTGFSIELEVFKSVVDAKTQDEKRACKVLIKRLKENCGTSFDEYLNVIN